MAEDLLENRIKESAQRLPLKDFSLRVSDICEAAGQDAVSMGITVMQPAAQVVAGKSRAARPLKAIIILSVCLFAILIAVAATLIITGINGSKNTAAQQPDEENLTEENGLTEGVADEVQVTEEQFYACFAEAGVTVADFTIYSDVIYSVTYSGQQLAGGGVNFNYDSSHAVCVQFYLESYSGFYTFMYAANGVYYNISGDLTEEIMQSVAANLE